MERSSGIDAARLCVLAAPELPAQLADELVRDLPGLSDRRVDVVLCLLGTDDFPLGGATSVAEIADAAGALVQEKQCDAVLCLTDVPLRAGNQPLVAAASAGERVATISIPAFGMTHLRPRVREAAVRLIGELFGESGEEAPGRPLTRRRLGDLPTPIRRRRSPEMRLPVQFVMSAYLGHMRLLSGMVRANRPWRAMSGLSTAVVAALATGAYAILNSIVWMLSGALDPLRLTAVMLVGITAIVAYLIVSHELWQPARESENRKDTALYNAATILTLLSAVSCAYVILFIALLFAAGLVVDADIFRSEVSHSVSAASYLRLAWLAASFATIAGALGSGLESIEEVREAAYGHNQRRRDHG